MKYGRLLCASVLLAVLAPRAAAQTTTTAPPGPAAPHLDRPLIVVSAPDAAGWVRLLRASGASARIGTLDEALDRPAALFSGGVALSSDQRSRVHDALDAGERAVVASDALLAELGLQRGADRPVASARMTGLDGEARWAPPVGVRPLQDPSVTPVATNGDAVLAGVAPSGRGQVFALAVDPLAPGRDGHELLPEIGRYTAAFTGAPFGPARTGADVYLDPGSLHNAVSAKPDDLAERLAGARAVHIAAWNADNQDPKFDYDYQALISALHARGVLAYAWLEPPFVSLRFWLEHPECRERTATGRDALVDWRRLIALEDPNCFRLATPVFSRVVSSWPFDGVDVAELYFEPDRKPEDFTPFHPSALAQFDRDPNADPAGFRAFRTQLVTDLNSKMLKFLNGLPHADQLDFQLTVVDNKLDPALGTQVGSDIDALAKVAKENGATLQVEDPFTVWTQGPLRYDALEPALRSLMPVGFAYPDVNVVDREAGYPTRTMTGAEFDLAVSSAGRGAGRVALYSAGTIAPADMAHMSAALGATAVVFDDGVESPWAVTVRAPGGASFTRLKVDGHQWPAAAGVAVVPAGAHRLEWSKGAPAGPGLSRFTGELGTASLSASRMTLHYDSRAIPYAVVDRPPRGRSSVANPGGGYTVRLPPGRHEVTLSFGGSSHSGGGGGSLLVVVVAALLVVGAALWSYRRLRRR
jgi:hypothetical protein